MAKVSQAKLAVILLSCLQPYVTHAGLKTKPQWLQLNDQHHSM